MSSIRFAPCDNRMDIHTIARLERRRAGLRRRWDAAKHHQHPSFACSQDGDLVSSVSRLLELSDSCNHHDKSEGGLLVRLYGYGYFTVIFLVGFTLIMAGSFLLRPFPPPPSSASYGGVRAYFTYSVTVPNLYDSLRWVRQQISRNKERKEKREKSSIRPYFTLLCFTQPRHDNSTITRQHLNHWVLQPSLDIARAVISIPHPASLANFSSNYRELLDFSRTYQLASTRVSSNPCTAVRRSPATVDLPILAKT